MALARLKVLKAITLLKMGTDTTYDKELKLMLEQATARVERMCERSLVQVTLTDEVYDGTGTKELWPRQWPVTALTAVKFWDGSAYTSESATYFEIINQQMLWYPKTDYEDSATYANWGSDERGIKLTYTAGYADTSWDTMEIEGAFTVPDDLEYAVSTIAALAYLQGRGTEKRLGLAGVNVGAQSVTFEKFLQGLPPDVEEIIMTYRRACY